MRVGEVRGGRGGGLVRGGRGKLGGGRIRRGRGRGGGGGGGGSFRCGSGEGKGRGVCAALTGVWTERQEHALLWVQV